MRKRGHRRESTVPWLDMTRKTGARSHLRANRQMRRVYARRAVPHEEPAAALALVRRGAGGGRRGAGARNALVGTRGSACLGGHCKPPARRAAAAETCCACCGEARRAGPGVLRRVLGRGPARCAPVTGPRSDGRPGHGAAMTQASRDTSGTRRLPSTCRACRLPTRRVLTRGQPALPPSRRLRPAGRRPC